MVSSSFPTYEVFISHSREDKASIAIPLRENLRKKGIRAFVDAVDMKMGDGAKKAIRSAMEKADIAVIVLSPEFVAKEWPMKELLYFLRRQEEAEKETQRPLTIIPFFYRLGIAELYGEPRHEWKDQPTMAMYTKARFFERMRRGDPEANVSIIQNALQKLHDVTGIENYVSASNETSWDMSLKRKVLLDKLSQAIIPPNARPIDQDCDNISSGREAQLSEGVIEIVRNPERSAIGGDITSDASSRVDYSSDTTAVADLDPSDGQRSTGIVHELREATERLVYRRKSVVLLLFLFLLFSARLMASIRGSFVATSLSCPSQVTDDTHHSNSDSSHESHVKSGYNDPKEPAKAVVDDSDDNGNKDRGRDCKGMPLADPASGTELRRERHFITGENGQFVDVDELIAAFSPLLHIIDYEKENGRKCYNDLRYHVEAVDVEKWISVLSPLLDNTNLKDGDETNSGPRVACLSYLQLFCW